MANPDVQPWTPDPDVAPGTPPVGGQGGERGTSVFPGNSAFNADGTPVDPVAVMGGPSVGTAYHPDAYSVSSRVVGGSRSSAHGTTFTVTCTPSSTTPTHGTSITFTVTVSDSAASGKADVIDGTTVLGQANISGGTGTLVLSGGLTTGTHNVRALFDGAYSSSTTVTAS